MQHEFDKSLDNLGPPGSARGANAGRTNDGQLHSARAMMNEAAIGGNNMAAERVYHRPNNFN